MLGEGRPGYIECMRPTLRDLPVNKSAKAIAEAGAYTLSHAKSLVPLLGVALFACLYVYVIIQPGRLTLAQDELWGTTSNLSLFDAIVFTLRSDIRPPILRTAESRLLGNNDLWTLDPLSSVATG
jgi:hypothetical protein